MYDQMKQLQEMKKKADALKRQLEQTHVERSNSSGTIKVKVNGAQQVESLQIENTWFVPEKREALQNSLRQMINEAFEEVQKKTALQMADQLKGLNIPGF